MCASDLWPSLSSHPLTPSKQFGPLPMNPFLPSASSNPTTLLLPPSTNPSFFFRSSQPPLSYHSSSCSVSHATLCDPTQPPSSHILTPIFPSPISPPLLSLLNSVSSSCLSLSRLPISIHPLTTMCSLHGHAVACCSHHQLIKVLSQLSD